MSISFDNTVCWLVYCSKIHISTQVAISVPNMPIVFCDNMNATKPKGYFRICNATFFAENQRPSDRRVNSSQWIGLHNANASALGDNVRMIVNIASKKIRSLAQSDFMNPGSGRCIHLHTVDSKVMLRHWFILLLYI